MQLPMSRIREASAMRVTYYAGDAESYRFPKEINGVVVKLNRNSSKRSISKGKRSMSASSANSNKSFRATKKRGAAPQSSTRKDPETSQQKSKGSGSKFNYKIPKNARNVLDLRELTRNNLAAVLNSNNHGFSSCALHIEEEEDDGGI